ncbi:MAG: MJ0042-type zinc finger domain-containing protein, partial [Acidobacteriota bacterium]
MAKFISLQCRNCDAAYAVPDAYEPHLEGRLVQCPACRRSWIPMPGHREGAPIEPSKVDLRRFRRRVTPEPEPAPPSAALPPLTDPWAATSTVEPLTLRVEVGGPGGNVSGLFELGERPFLIGRSAGHLKLPKSTIPDRALAITAVPGGFHVTGLEGFQ